MRTKPSPTARVKLILATPKTGWIVHILKLSGGENDKNRKELRIHKKNEIQSSEQIWGYSGCPEPKKSCTVEIRAQYFPLSKIPDLETEKARQTP